MSVIDAENDSMRAPQPLPVYRETPFDPPSALATLPPIGPMLFAGGAQGWIVTSHRLAREVLADNRFSADRSLAESPMQAVPQRFRDIGPAPGMFNMMDPPAHTRYRRLLTPEFTVHRMKRLEPRISQIVQDTLREMEKLPQPVDLVTAFALPVPMTVICEFLGVGLEHVPMVTRVAAVLLSVNSTIEELANNVDELRKYMFGLIEERRARPDDALISSLLENTDLTDDEIVSISQVLLLAGHETSANMLGIGTFCLLQHPDQWDRLRREPELMPGAVEELLRYLTVAHMGPIRAALEDIEVGGVTVRKGQTVMISLPRANRDPELLDGGETLDVTRARCPHLAFGHGVHQCIGSQLARSEMVIGFAALIERFPNLRLAIPAADVPMRTDMRVYGVHTLPVEWD
jgi:cytochrome P450